MAERLRAYPLRTSLVLEAFFVALTLLGAVALRAAFPSLPGYSVRGPSQSLVLVLVAAALLLALIAALRWWRLAASTRPAEWRDLHLYWLPIALLAVPVIRGIRAVPLGALGVLVVGYAATAVFEEGLWRGVILGLLRPTGVWQAVLISSVLFGLAHLGNSALRGFSVIVALQAFGAAVQGIGFAALRLRTNTIWPLILIHMLHDLFLQMGNLPIAAVDAPIATILAMYGILLLRGRRDLATPDGDADAPAGRQDWATNR
jgi:membrane protease YdiL (CAAX protease family)